VTLLTNFSAKEDFFRCFFLKDWFYCRRLVTACT